MTSRQVRCRAGKSDLSRAVAVCTLYSFPGGERERERSEVNYGLGCLSSVPVGEKLKDPRLSPSHVSPC